MNNRRYHVIVGSKSYFYKKVSNYYDDSVIPTFLDLVKEADECKQRGISFDNHADNLIIPNDNYHGITEQAHDRIGVLIEELTHDNAEIFIHNPSTVLKHFLDNLQNEEGVVVDYDPEEYYINKNESEFVQNMKNISTNIIGQKNAIKEISKSMWYLTKTKRQKPYVIMLYGNSSLGKTELVREIAKKFYDNKYYEKHLSMFKNDTYSDYFFGEKPNRRSLGYDLLERESNLIFLDELDKCPMHFFSAFYTLFDNVVFKDASYEADISGLLIILTSNYLSEKEIMNNLGLPIYYRIDKFIPFDDFSIDTIHTIVQKEILDRKEEYEGLYTAEQIYASVCSEINIKNENARTIKYKVQKVIECLLLYHSLFFMIKKENL